MEKSRMENEIEKWINFRHLCITGPIGFVFPIESDNRQELKIVRLYSEGCSLAKALSVNPVWWTSTVKRKAIAGIVLGLRFARSFGLVHGGLTANDILFDSDDCIRIVDFKPILLEAGESESEEATTLGAVSIERWKPLDVLHGMKHLSPPIFRSLFLE
jgi:serine/threonine protein kinase